MARLKSDMHPLLTENVVKQLFTKGINSVKAFLEVEIKNIASCTTLTYKDILSIRQHLINKNSAFLRNGHDYYRELLKQTAILPTGLKSFDQLLNGGLSTGNLYEICGLPGSGKTQLCLTLCKNIGKTLEQNVYYIDTKQDFSAKRIKQMLEAEECTESEMQKVMEKILVKHVDTKYELVNSLYGIKAEISAGLKLRLIIIDSLPPVFYNSIDIIENNGMMNHLVNIVRFLCKEHHVVVFTTNLLSSWTASDFGEELNVLEKIGLGKYWFTVPNCRFLIKNTEQEGIRRISVLNSTVLPLNNFCDLLLTTSGFS